MTESNKDDLLGEIVLDTLTGGTATVDAYDSESGQFRIAFMEVEGEAYQGTREIGDSAYRFANELRPIAAQPIDDDACEHGLAGYCWDCDDESTSILLEDEDLDEDELEEEFPNDAA